MRRLQIETPVRFDRLQRLGMDAIHHQMQVKIVGIGMERIQRLMRPYPEFVEKQIDCLLQLRWSRLLAFPPAQHPVLNRIPAGDRLLSQGDHLGLLTGAARAQAIARARIHAFLLLLPVFRSVDVIDQPGHPRGLARRPARIRFNLFDDHRPSVRWRPRRHARPLPFAGVASRRSRRVWI